MKKAFWTYIFGLILFGSNGVAASCIHLTSQQIVLLRTLLGFALLAVLYLGGAIFGERASSAEGC